MLFLNDSSQYLPGHTDSIRCVCIIIMNEPTAEHCFDVIIKMCLEVMFSGTHESYVGFVFIDLKNEAFPTSHSNYNFKFKLVSWSKLCMKSPIQNLFLLSYVDSMLHSQPKGE